MPQDDFIKSFNETGIRHKIKGFNETGMRHKPLTRDAECRVSAMAFPAALAPGGIFSETLPPARHLNEGAS
jgi:hypothetical protein